MVSEAYYILSVERHQLSLPGLERPRSHASGTPGTPACPRTGFAPGDEDRGGSMHCLMQRGPSAHLPGWEGASAGPLLLASRTPHVSYPSHPPGNSNILTLAS